MSNTIPRPRPGPGPLGLIQYAGVIDITERLERLYVDTGANYVQEAAREIRNLRVEVERLQAEVANLTKIIDDAWGEA